MMMPANFSAVNAEVVYGGAVADYLPNAWTAANVKQFSTNIITLVSNSFFQRVINATLGTMFSGSWGDDNKLFGDDGSLTALYKVGRVPGGDNQNFGNKIMTTGAGGFVVSNHADWAEHAKHLSTQAKADMLQFLHDEVGYNYRMTNVQACLGLAQLERLEGFVETKKARYAQYKAALDGVHGLRILPFKEESDGVRSNHWFYSLYLKDSGLDRDTVIAKLQEQGIQTRPVWALINEQADYPKNEAYALEKAQDYRKYIVNLPCSTNLTEQDCERVIAAVKNL